LADIRFLASIAAFTIHAAVEMAWSHATVLITEGAFR
jgi:hypothetical protein